MSDISEAKKLIDQKEREVQALEEAARLARAKLEADKKQLVLLSSAVTSLIRANSITTSATNAPAAYGDDTSTPGGATTYGHIKRAMREVIRWMPGTTFSTRDVITQLSAMNPEINVEGNRANISNYLRDFATEGLIKLEQEGSGQRPAIYRKSNIAALATMTELYLRNLASYPDAGKKP